MNRRNKRFGLKYLTKETCGENMSGDDGLDNDNVDGNLDQSRLETTKGGEALGKN